MSGEISRYGSPEVEARFDQQMRQHRHNGNLGVVTRARNFLKGISEDSLTDLAKDELHRARTALSNLEEDIYCYRKDLDGSIATIKHKKPHDETVF